jgi:hypothetical protein
MRGDNIITPKMFDDSRVEDAPRKLKTSLPMLHIPTPSAKTARHPNPAQTPFRVWMRSTGVNDFWVGVGDNELAGSD